MPRTRRPPRRLLRRALIAAGGVVLILVLLATLAPTIISSGLGRGAIRAVIQQRLDGSVSLTGLDLGWFGPQSVTGFAVQAHDGVTAVRLDLTINAGLLGLVTGDVEAITVELSGKIRGELRPDGSTTFANLFARTRTPDTPRSPPAADGAPFSLAGVPPVTLRLAGVSVALAEQGSDREYSLDDLHGELSYAPGEQVKLDLAGDVTGGATTGSVTVTGRIAGLTDLDGALTPDRASGRIDVRLRDVPVPLTNRSTSIRSLALTVTSLDPTDRIEVTVEADAVIDGTESGRLEGTFALADPMNSDGSVRVRLEQVTGHLVGRAMPTALLQLLQGYLAGTPFVATRDLGPAFDIDADFSAGETRQVSVRVRTAAVELDFEGTVDAGRRLDTERLHITAAVHPELVFAITGLTIDRAADLVIEIDSLSVPPGGLRDLAMSGTVTLRQPLTLRQVPGLVEPLGIRDMEAAVTVTGGPTPSISLEGTARLRRAASDTDLAALGYTATTTFGDTMAAEVSLRLRGLAVGELDGMTGGKLGDDLLEFIGATGDVDVTLSEVSTDATRATIGVEFPYLAGDFTARMADETVSITADNLSVTLPRAALQKRLAPSGAPSPRTTVVADVPMTLLIRSMRVPLAMLTGEPFDGEAVDIDLELRGGPLVLDDAKIGRNSIKDLRITLAGSDLDAGLTAKVTGLVEFAGAAGPGRIELAGTVADLMTDGVLTAGQATLAMTATVDRLHTAVIDGLADMQGLLVAALGPRMDAVATASNFSRDTGVLEVRIQASNGWLDGMVYGANNALLIKADEPLRAELELTAPLRQRLLYKINPLLADIRTTEQPLRVSIGESSIPLDGDVSRLDALLEITIGRVEFDSGSQALMLLTLANASNARTISGEIEPIKARIRKGVVTYERFAVKLDKYTLIYSGWIDLNTRYVNLRSEVPLEGLAGTFHELEGLTDDVSIPILYRGPFGNVKAEVEPEFLAEAAATIGIRAGLDELEKKTGVPIRDIFDGIFGKKKKKRD